MGTGSISPSPFDPVGDPGAVLTNTLPTITPIQIADAQAAAKVYDSLSADQKQSLLTNFDSVLYLASNPDIAANTEFNHNALTHYLEYNIGHQENRAFPQATNTNPASLNYAENRDEINLDKEIDQIVKLKPDTVQAYVDAFSQLPAADRESVLRTDFDQIIGVLPSDAQKALAVYNDLSNAQRQQILNNFDGQLYRDQNPDIKASAFNQDPLIHYLEYNLGHNENRPFPQSTDSGPASLTYDENVAELAAAYRATPNTSSDAPKVYVIDQFASDTTSGELGPGIDHGNITSGLISGETGIKPTQIALGQFASYGQFLNNISSGIKQVMNSSSGSLNSVYVNVSLGERSTDISGYPNELAQLKDTIDQLTDRGAKVFFSAGNDYENPLANLPNVISVGSTTRADRVGDVYANSNGIDIRADPRVYLATVPGGIDITGDHTPEFPNIQLSQLKKGNIIEGTSFSAPRALADAIVTKIIPTDINKPTTQDTNNTAIATATSSSSASRIST